VFKDLKVRKGRRGLLALRAFKVHKGRRALLDLLAGLLGSKARKGVQALRVLKVQLASKDRKVLQVQLVQ
jgi:hypothetical protein